MMTIEQAAQHFLAIGPQKKPERLAFYHYLKNFHLLQNPFDPEVIDQFYDRALAMAHWQQNKNTLGEVLKSDLAAIGARHDFGFNLDQVVHSDNMQVLNLEQPRDFAALLAKLVASYEKSGEKVKSIRLNQDKSQGRQEVMLIRLIKTGSIKVEIRQNVGILLDGEVQLVRPHSKLCYTSDLDFETNVDQFLSTSLLRVVRFRMRPASGSVVKGSIIQGASFHCTENFERPLNDLPELFQAIKNMERFYINPVTDPYYHQLVEQYGRAFHEKNI